MAPELLDGQEPSIQSDLHALGAVIYELVAGRRPFPGKTESDIRRLQHAPPPRPSAFVRDLDPAYDTGILWCLDSDPDKRPTSALEVEKSLPPPSAKMVADQGGSGRLQPRIALALAAVAILGFLLHAAVADHAMAYRQIPPMKPTARLQVEAARIAEDSSANRDYSVHQRKGFSLLSSRQTKTAFDLRAEPE